jgi:hypothetical protein
VIKNLLKREGVSEETTTGVHRLYQMPKRQAALPGHQRQRLGHQEQVRQPLRLPRLAGRRHQARHRRDAWPARSPWSAATATSARARRSRCGPGRARHGHRDRPDLRAAGGDGRLRGQHLEDVTLDRRHLRHHHRQQGRHHRSSTCADEGQGHRLQHRPLRQRDRQVRRSSLRRASRGSTSSRRSTSHLPDGHGDHRSCWPKAAW